MADSFQCDGCNTWAPISQKWQLGTHGFHLNNYDKPKPWRSCDRELSPSVLHVSGKCIIEVQDSGGVQSVTYTVPIPYLIIRSSNHTIAASNEPIAPCGGIRQCRICSPDLHYIAGGSYSSEILYILQGFHTYHT